MLERAAALKLDRTIYMTNRERLMFQIIRMLGHQQFCFHEGPVISSASYLPPLLQTVVSTIVDQLDTKLSKPAAVAGQENASKSAKLDVLESLTDVSLHLSKPLDIEVFNAWFDEAWSCHEHVLKHDGKSFQTKKASIRCLFIWLPEYVG